MKAALTTPILALALLAAAAGAQSTTRVSVNSAAAQAGAASHAPAISGDGRYVAFESDASDLVPGDTNAARDVFVRDCVAGTTTRMSVDAGGAQADGPSGSAAISADGRWVAFRSTATNLVPADGNGLGDIFVHDRLMGDTRRASVSSSGQEANGDSRLPTLSADGQVVAYESDATNLVTGDTNNQSDVFVHELGSALTTRADLLAGGGQSGGNAGGPSLSADGNRVVFHTTAALLASDTNFTWDVYLHERSTLQVTRVSLSSLGVGANSAASWGRVSGDGLCVSFTSVATNLVTGDTNGQADIFVRQLASGVTRRASVSSSGAESHGWPVFSGLSADGRMVMFESNAGDLVAGDTNPGSDVFVHDLGTGQTTRVSVDSAGVQGDSFSSAGSISTDGRFVAFESMAANLVAGDTNDVPDVFLRDRRNQTPPIAFCFGDGTQAPACPCANSGQPGRGCENSAATGGAWLVASGSTLPETLQLTTSGELPGALSIFLQGNVELSPGQVFGDGLRCAGGALKRLYVKGAVAGSVSAPVPGDAPVSVRSAQLGDSIVAGTSRCYQVYYRDPDAGFCSAPTGNSWNVSNALRIGW